MVLFHYEAMNAAGQSVKADLEAATIDDAMAQLRAQGYYPTRLKQAVRQPKVAAGPKPAKKLGQSIVIGRVSTRALADFTRQFSTLQDAGLPIVRSLKVLWQQERAGVLKNALADVSTKVEEGST